ncbi:hypothetical protein ACJX0J_032682 [Zea mays]
MLVPTFYFTVKIFTSGMYIMHKEISVRKKSNCFEFFAFEGWIPGELVLKIYNIRKLIGLDGFYFLAHAVCKDIIIDDNIYDDQGQVRPFIHSRTDTKVGPAGTKGPSLNEI